MVAVYKCDVSNHSLRNISIQNSKRRNNTMAQNYNHALFRIESEENIGYYTRSKRRKLEGVDNEKWTNTRVQENFRLKRKNFIMTVEVEVLRMVFSYIPYHELSQNVRLVNKRFKLIAEDVLNCSFKKINRDLNQLMKVTKVSLSHTQDDMEIRCVLKMLNFLEILELKYTVIYATIWRYVYNKYYKGNCFSMYAGSLIEAFRTFIQNIQQRPHWLYSPSIVNDYALPTEITRIIQLTKSFCIHFDKVNEELGRNCLKNSGCKMIDLLDSGRYVEKRTFYENIYKNDFNAKYSYFFRNAWLIALPIKSTKEMDWPQKQRMMHLRLRRLVVAHNEMFLTQAQYERELTERLDQAGTIRKPGNIVYSGYGDSGKIFYFYGAMNDMACHQSLFNLEEATDEEESDQGVEEEQPQVRPQGINSEEDIFCRVAHLGFRLDVTVRCPVAYAPLNYLSSMDEALLDAALAKTKKCIPTEIKLEFDCPGAKYMRLPGIYKYMRLPEIYTYNFLPHLS